MAGALDLSNEVLRVFANSHRNEMTLIELHNILVNRIPRITTDEVLRIVRLPNLINIFNLQSISNDLCLVQLNPKLTLCEDCLQKGCKKMNCTKLHLCRYISHFSNKPLEKPCHFPHNLTGHPNNRVLLRQYNYDTLDDNILLQLLRRYYEQIKRSSSSQNDHYHNSSKTPNHRFNKSRPPSQLKKMPIPIDNLIERQLDICIPSERDATEVDLEIVQLLLATKNIIVERILEKQISNEFYRRFTLQFNNKQIIDNILQTEPIIIYNKIPIKMKRTLKQKDTKIFALKFNTDKKIDNVRLNLYVETLVGKVNLNIFDMTSDGNNEQIYLIRCEQSIDFDHLYKVHSAKSTLQGYRVIITEIYETETLEISFVHKSLHSPMSIPRLRQLFGETRWQQDVFACLSIRDENSADIELMNAEITAKWLAEANRFERDLSLLIRPIIDFIQSEEKNEDEDDEEITELLGKSSITSSRSPLSVSDDSQKGENDPNIYTIKPDWRIVLTHPVFGDEYRKYIRENLNISAQITGSSIEVPNEYIRKELARYTNMFIQNFIFRELSDLDKTQVKMIKDNYSRMAHKWQKDTNKTLIAARRDVINELFPQSTSTNRQQNKTINTPIFRSKQSPISRKQDDQSTTPTFRYKQSPTPRKQDQQSTPSVLEESIQTKITEDNDHTLPYPIENSVYFPFFSTSNSFSNRLSTYLLDTFNIKLDIKTVSSTKILLELKGQYKDISDARPALTLLFSSLKTKNYSDTNDCKFSIPDFYRVAQWNLDQCSIVSSCSFSTKNGGTLSVRYFADNPQFGVDEQKLDYILIQNLVSMSYQVLITSKKLETNLQKLQNEIQQRSDYGQDICCLYNDQKELPSIHLCGIKSIVQKIYQEVKTIGDEYTPILCTVQLKPNSVNYLLQICSNDLIKFEKEYEKDGVDLRSKLKSDTISQFLAPKYLHEKIKLLLLEMSQIETISKDFQCSAQLIKSKKQELNKLATKNRCLMTITSSTQPTVPTTSKISSGSIHISNDDLTTEQSDVLVVCSTSEKLRGIMIKAAGTQVEQELVGNDLTKTMIPTSAGQLKQAKRLLFLPWTPPATFFTNQDINALRQSISAFIQQAIKYTIQGKFQSIAFPAIGCGGFGIPPDIIATIMINAVHEQLTLNPGVQLKITFVVQQANVYDVFKSKLKPTSTGTTASRARSPSPSSNQEKVTITLTTSNSNIDIAKKILTTIEDMLN